jgi:hypothetical protein
MKEKLKIYQIYYKEDHEADLDKDFVWLRNDFHFPGFESEIIFNFLENGGWNIDSDWIGFFSHSVGNKLNNYSLKTIEEAIDKNPQASIISPKINNYKIFSNKKTDKAQDILEDHLEIRNSYFELLKYLYQYNIFEKEFIMQELALIKNPIYCNFWVAKSDLYINFFKKVIGPILKLYRSDSHINFIMNKESYYINPYKDDENFETFRPSNSFIQSTGLEYFPCLPFCLERMINSVIIHDSIKRGLF